MTTNLKGNLLAIASSILQASVLIFWAYLLGVVSRPTLMIYWFGAASIIMLGYLVISKNLNFKFSIKLVPLLIVFGLSSGLTTLLLMTGAKMVGASVTSLIMNTTVLFTLLYSTFSLKEKFSKLEYWGIAIILISLLILNWQASASITMSSLIIVVAAFSESTTQFLAKKLLPSISSPQLNFIRVFSIFLFGMIYLFASGATLQLISINNGLIVIAGVILGPILIFTLYYSALRKINLATANALSGFSSLFTFILAFLFLRESLTLTQIVSLIVFILGTYLVIKSRSLKQSNLITK